MIFEYRISSHVLKDIPALFAGLSESCPQTVFCALMLSVSGNWYTTTGCAEILCKIVFLYSLLCVPAMSQKDPKTFRCDNSAADATAIFLAHEIQLNAAHPSPEWESAPEISFCSDWQGKNPDARRETRVRLLWTQQTLYLRFVCSFRSLFVFDDADPSGRRDHLWDRDVAEVFLQPDPRRERYYKEIEVAPNGMWIDLDITPGPLQNLNSGMRHSVLINKALSKWTSEVAIPMKALTENFDPRQPWKVNFFRVEGSTEPRSYLAWRATNTPEPNFHVPAAFGKLHFSGAPTSDSPFVTK